MKKFSLLVILLFITSISFCQSEVNYNNKSILKEISKIEKNETVLIEEINIPDNLNKQYPVSGKYFYLKNRTIESQINYVYIGRVNTCRAGGCSSPDSKKVEPDSEYFDYFILFDSLGKVKRVKIFNYQATHGQEITVKGWLKQFNGYDGSSDLIINKNIDAISGATISVYAITLDVQINAELLNLLLKNSNFN